jgi:hypothetical protein
MVYSQTPPIQLAANDMNEVSTLTTETKIIGTVTTTVEKMITATNSQGEERTLKTGDPIYLHDTITTGKESYVKITLNDGTILQFGPSSNARLDKYTYDPDAGWGEFESFISSGTFRYVSGKISGNNQGQHSLIKTPSAYIGIRGSEVDAQIYDDGSTSILHLSGLITVSSRYHAGEQTIYERGTRIYIPNTSTTTPGIQNLQEKSIQQINDKWNVFNSLEGKQELSFQHDSQKTGETIGKEVREIRESPDSSSQKRGPHPSSPTDSYQDVDKLDSAAEKIRDDAVSPHRHGEHPHPDTPARNPAQRNSEDHPSPGHKPPPSEAKEPPPPPNAPPPQPPPENTGNPPDRRPIPDNGTPSTPNDGTPSNPNNGEPPTPNDQEPPTPNDQEPSTPNDREPSAPNDGEPPDPDKDISEPDEQPTEQIVKLQLVEDTSQRIEIVENKPIRNFTQPSEGEVINNNDGTLTYTPPLNFHGEVQFSYTLEDTSVITVELTVNPVNDPPELLIKNETLTLSNENPFTIPIAELLKNVQDIDNDKLQVSEVRNSQQGNVNLNENNIVFTPQKDFINGGFDYVISDGESTVVGHLTLNRDNFPPRANDDNITINKLEPLTINSNELLANDIDGENDSLTLVSVNNGNNGSAVFNPITNTLTFTPTTDLIESKTGQFSYEISDEQGNHATATVTLNWNNQPPSATDDILPIDTLDTIQITPDELLGNDTDPDGDRLTIVNVNNEQNGSLLFNDNNNAITFMPIPELANLGFGGFDYEISDNQGNTVTASVQFTFKNQPPIAHGDGPFNLGQQSSITITTAELISNDRDINDDSLTLTGIQNPVNGTAILNAAGDIVFTKAEETNNIAGNTWNGSFEYEISDGRNGTATAQVILTGEVNPLKPADDEKTGSKNQAVVLSFAFLLGNDLGINFPNDLSTITELNDPLNGNVEFGEANNIIFTPTPDFVGEAGFHYVVSDEQGNTATAHVTLLINNQSPVANLDENFTTTANTPLTISLNELLTNDRDPDNDPLKITDVSTVSQGQVEFIDENQILFTPNPDFIGTANFAYTVKDTIGASATATVTVTVTPQQGVTDTLTTTKNTELNIPSAQLLANDNSNDLTITEVNPISHGNVVLESNGNIQFTPHPDFTGEAQFQYTAVDNAGRSITTMVTISVANTLPNPQSDTITTAKNTALTLTTSELLANDNDADPQDKLTIIAVANAKQGEVELIGREIIFTPTNEFIGEAHFDYTVADSSDAMVTATVTVVVTDNQPPVINLPNSANTLIYNTNDPATAIDSTATVTDPDSANFDGGTLTVTMTNRTTNDLLQIQNQADITVSSNSGGDIAFNGAVIGRFFTNFATGDLSVSLNAQADINATNALLQAITFRNTATTPNTHTRIVEMTLTDGDGGTSKTVNRQIEITQDNASPMAKDDELELPYHSSYTLPMSELLNNDRDPDPTDIITISEISALSEGIDAKIVDNEIQLFIDALVSDDLTNASFDYTINDGNGGEDTATVTLLPNNVIFGTSGADTLDSTSTLDIIVGGAGNDTFSAPTGADVLLGGENDDVFLFNPTTAVGTIIEGGPGNDTLSLAGTDRQVLDLVTNRTLAANQQFQLQSIETIDMSSNTEGNTQLRLTVNDVLEISDNGILTIEGDTTTMINAAGQGWNNQGTDTSGLYNHYTNGSAELLVSVDIINQFIS